MKRAKHYEFDVAISYAGEDREYAEALAETLRQRMLKVFYDNYEKSTLWGKNLYTYLSDVYENKARYCVLFRCHSESCVKEKKKKSSCKTDTTGIDSSFGRDRSFDSTPHKEGTMPVPKKKRITAENEPFNVGTIFPTAAGAASISPAPRTLAQSAVRTVLELVMREELDAFIGAAWGECSPKRKGYRNGTYTRDLATATGRLEDLKVPRDREGHFHTQAFERYQRYEPHIAEGLTQMFVAGVSTHKVGEVAQTLLGVAPSASTISRLNQTPHPAI